MGFATIKCRLYVTMMVMLSLCAFASAFSGQKKVLGDNIDITLASTQASVCRGTDPKGTTVLMQQDNYEKEAAVICKNSHCDKGIAACQKGKYVCLCA